MTATLPFVGRHREVAALRTAMDSALCGQGTVVLISGEAGIGKTTLAELLCNEASERGALVLTGRCYDLTETAPFAPWIELLNTYPAGDSLPEIPDSLAHLDTGETAPGQTTIFAAFRRFLAEVSAVRPVVLLLDDQHWTDDVSLELLRYLARQAAQLRLFLLVTYRTEEVEPTHSFSQLLPLLAREARAMRINLGPLSYDDLWSLIRPRYRLDAGDEARLVSYLHDRTEGNPFFASELLQTLEEERVLRLDESKWTLGDLGAARTPILIEQIIGGRLAQLSKDDQQILEVAAVLGQEIPLSLWGEVANTGQEALLNLLDRAIRARLMTETRDGLSARFTHALIRQVIYDQLAPSRRRLWHQRAGSTLAAMAMPDPDAVANHFRRSGDPRAAEWLIRAGGRAQRASSWRQAAELFEAAVEAMDISGTGAEKQGWLLVRIALMRRYSATDEGLARLEEAGRIASAAGDRPLAAMVLWQSGLLHCLKGNVRYGIEQLDRGTAEIAALPPEERERLLASEPIAGFLRGAYQGQGTLAAWQATAGHFTEAIERAEAHLADTGIQGRAGDLYSDAFTALGVAHAALGNPDQSRAAFRGARAALPGDPQRIHLARTYLIELHHCTLPYQTDNIAERRGLEKAAAQAWEQASETYAESLADSVRLPLHVIEGRWDEARRVALEILDRGTSSNRAEATYWLGPLARAQGDTELARALVMEWFPDGPATAPGNTIFPSIQSLQRLAAALALDAGDLPAARRWLEAGDHWLDWSGALLGKAEHLLAWADYYRAGNDQSEARRYAENALQLAMDPRQPLALIAAHRILGEIDTSEQRYTEAAAHLDAASTLAEACATPYERALTAIAMAELDLARDNVDLAAERLAGARAVFESLGAKPALLRAEALATQIESVRSTERVSAPEESTPAIASDRDRELLAELSPREIDVLRLLPEGRTNQEIADRLFLSPKTVENHVGRILAKTNLPNRAAAAAFAQRLGLA